METIEKGITMNSLTWIGIIIWGLVVTGIGLVSAAPLDVTQHVAAHDVIFLVSGGLLGNQVGGGTGRQIATVAGAVGGAVVGNQVEGNMKATTTYEIRVRLDDGTLRTFNQSSAPQWSSGDRVRIVKGRLRAA